MAYFSETLVCLYVKHSPIDLTLMEQTAQLNRMMLVLNKENILINTSNIDYSFTCSKHGQIIRHDFD